MPNIALLSHQHQPTEATGSAKICSPSAGIAEPPHELCDVSHMIPVSDGANNQRTLSNGLHERPASILLENCAGRQFRYYMSILNEYINSPLVDESEMDTRSSSIPTLPALEILTEPSDFRPVQVIHIIVNGSTLLIRSASMPNYHVHFGDAIVNLDTHNPEKNTRDSSRDETRQDVGASDLSTCNPDEIFDVYPSGVG